MTDEEYDLRVAELDYNAFREVVEIMDGLIRSAEGGIVYLQPGDATRYVIEVGATRTFTVSNDRAMEVSARPPSWAKISFGTERGLKSEPLGRLGELEPDHPWTAAVWRRLYEMLMVRLEGVL